MEAALDGPNKQRGLLSLMNREEVDPIPTTTRTYSSTMSTTSLVSPTSTSNFQNGPPPPYSSWSGPPPHPTSGLRSPPGSRRTSDNKTDPPPLIQTISTTRQSLPSLQEALSSAGTKPNPYASPVSALPQTLPPSHQNAPLSHTQAPITSRAYSTEHLAHQPHLAPSQTRRPSPPLPPQAHPSLFSRNNSIPSAYPESRHLSLTTAHGPPNPYAVSRYEPSRYEQDSRAPERSNGYALHPPPTQQSSYQYGPASSHVPPPGTSGPTYSQPRYQHRDGREPLDGWKSREGYKTEQGHDFSHGLKRHLDVWDFENNLAQINTSSRVLLDWSHHYNAIAQEQQRGTNTIPDRMPTLENCKEMLEQGEMIAISLSRMKDMITQQENYLMDQRMRDPGGKGSEFDDEMAMYGPDGDKHGFVGSEGKKQRRGRAAPPGRCHSCNRAETPEWRRGPDGARTLCNACGLHYAKLTRKQTMKQSQGSNGSSLRPKSLDDPPSRAI